MTDEIQIRKVGVEFLRPGPPHNQLLSPLTQYLAICGDAGAGVVTVPYEHAVFERRVKELRYETGDSEDRLAMLHDVGVDMGRILGAVPGLPGALTSDPGSRGTLVHLRLTLSASELAHLPFELAKVPIGPTATAESWLAIQTRPPVSLTRNIRTVSPEGVVWPERPRILFISADPQDVPFDEHRNALVAAIEDFAYPGHDDPAVTDGGAREQFGTLLTVLRNPTLGDVLAECRGTAYTHVHILAHGDPYASSPDAYGLVLRGQDGGPDVVSGERFASALTSVGGDRIRRPTVVTVASCDSGNVGTVTIPGASFAHALHQSGIPLVVASQFPLSKPGSVPLAATLYPGLLWGEHPLVLLQRLRAELHARYTSRWHDWASLVVYEALPQALDDQLDTLRYHQAKRAMDAGLQHVDLAIQQPTRATLRALDARIERAVARLPLTGQYAVECVGLRASSRKRRAQAAFTLTRAAPRETASWVDPFDLLEQAWLDYDQGVRGLLINEGRAVQRVAVLHWVLVQVVSLAAVLGKPFDEERWIAAKLSADLYREHRHVEQRAWAYGSLAELWLLRLCQEGLSEAQRLQSAQKALHHADELVRAYPARAEFPVISTLRQFQRYAHWWGHADFADGLAKRTGGTRLSWDDCGLVATAKRLIEKLERKAPAEVGARPPPASPAGSPMSGQGTPGGAGPGAIAPPTTAAARSRAVRSAATPRRPRSGAFFDIEMFPAGHGDALWIEYGEGTATHRWLIDCGTQPTAKLLAQRVQEIPARERMLELFVMTHIDADHIGGALPFLGVVKRGLRFADVWFNGWRHLSDTLGARQGEMFSSAIQDLALPWNLWRDGGAIVADGDALPTKTLPGGMKLTLLSPTPAKLTKLAPVWKRELERHGLVPGARIDYSRFLKGAPSTSTDVDALADEPFTDDKSPPNGSSIALLAEFGGAAALFGADAHAEVLANAVRRLLKERDVDRLKLDAFKLAHHGSQNNLSAELLQLLDCPRFLLSSNGDYFAHPDREAVARAIRYGRSGTTGRPVLHFNYRSRCSNVWAGEALQEQYGYSAVYPAPEQAGLRVSLLAGA
jgi:beta-lactamase superfamily II metal-dependent hydrolase